MMNQNDTTAMADKLAAYLKQELAGFRGPLSLHKFPGGQSNPTFRVDTPDGQYVLRRKPAGELLASAHAVDREFRVLKALEHTEVPVAKPLLLCENESVIGSMFYLMSFEQGNIFWDPALPELPREERSALFNEQIRVLAAMHNVDIQAVGLGDYGRPGNYYERQISRWTKQYRAAETEHIESMEALINWLPANIPADDGQISLIHGDYRLDNLMFAPGESRVLAVLDWELSTLGHPLADLAYLCMCMRLPDNGAIKGLGKKDRGALGIPTEQEMIDQYCRLRDISEIDDWGFYLAFSFFRIAAICQGVYKRAQMGNASDKTASSRPNITGPLAAMGNELIQ